MPYEVIPFSTHFFNLPSNSAGSNSDNSEVRLPCNNFLGNAELSLSPLWLTAEVGSNEYKKYKKYKNVFLENCPILKIT